MLLRARIHASLEKKRLRDQQRELIRKFATSEVAEDLLVKGFSLGGRLVEATVMFSDIRSFTTITESQSPEETIDLLNTYYTLMFEAIGNHSGVVNQMQGDGLMSIFGAPVPHPDHASQAVRAALEMIELIELFNMDQTAQGKIPINWDRDRLWERDRRLHRHLPSGNLHLRRRYGQPGCPAGSAHKNGRPANFD